MKVVSVINYKGGVGKTTLTANLGAYAAAQGKRVLMIDLDPQTHLTFSFMTPEYWSERYADNQTLKNYFENVIKEDDNIPPLSSLVIHMNVGIGSEKLDLLSSHLELINIDVELAGSISGVTRTQLAAKFLKLHSYLKKEIEKMSDDYDLVLIDCPPNFYVMVKNALLASDYYIVPAKLDYLSTLGVSELRKKIEEFLSQYDEYRLLLNDNRYQQVSLSLLGIVPNMVSILKGDELIKAQADYMEELKKEDYYIFKYIRNNGTVFGVVPLNGVPAVLTRPKFNLTARKIVKELKELGDEFLSKL